MCTSSMKAICINKLKCILSLIKMHHNANQCTHFLADAKDKKKEFLLIANSSDLSIILLIKSNNQLLTIYIIDSQHTHYEKCIQDYCQVTEIL